MKSKSAKLALMAMLCASLFFSCTSDIEPPPLPPDELSSSSLRLSSSSVEILSSSSTTSSSSSPVALSSSSLRLSSSSVEILSSSSTTPSSSSDLCAGFVDGTTREHYGKTKAQFCDPRDGKKYVYVQIGGPYWMAENLNYEAIGSKCYNNEPARCTTYGKLYNWATAMALQASCNSSSCALQVSRGICPSGWHIPSNADWDKLMRYVDGNTGTSSPYYSYTAGSYLKATNGWDSNGNGQDTYGFSALPGGDGFSDGSFDYVGGTGSWWSSLEGNASGAYGRGKYYNNEYAIYSNVDKSILFSVRCVKD